MCGKEVSVLSKAEIEGTIVEVCDRCIRFGTKIIEKPKYKLVSRPIVFKELKENEFELIPNYGKTIVRYRELKGLTREEFAKKINEKVSVIKRLEEEQMEPSEELTKRIESFLEIKLMERYQERFKQPEGKRKGRLTVGDIVEVS